MAYRPNYQPYAIGHMQAYGQAADRSVAYMWLVDTASPLIGALALA